MWSLLRPARPLKIRRYWLWVSKGIFPIGAIPAVSSTKSVTVKEVCDKLSVRSSSSCSQTGIRSDHWNDGGEVGVSVLETHALDESVEDRNVEEVEGDELAPEMDFFDCEEKGATDDIAERINASMELVDSIAEAPNVSDFMDGLVKEGNELSRDDISMIMEGLQERQLNWKGIQFSEWLETSMDFETTEQDYAFHLNCIGKVQGLRKAESFLKKIPESFRGELVYLALLKCCVHAGNIKKAEAMFQKMRSLGLPLTVDVCNQMIILYKLHGRINVFDILSTMEMENIKPSLLTCRLLIDLKGMSNDIRGMEELHKFMMAEGMEPDIYTLSIMARHYYSKGFRGKANIILQEIEERKQKNAPEANEVLLPLYASFVKADQVSRIWEDCRSDPKKSECIAAIEAWGMLGEVEEAEAVSFLMLEKWKRYSLKHFTSILDVYVKNKLLTKGEDLVQQIGDAVMPSQFCWDALVSLYIAAGDIAKADSFLQKAIQQRQSKPLFRTFIKVMEVYARQGDVPHTEKWFCRMRESGYKRVKSFEVLIHAYINARTPAYGFEERMKADSLRPNKLLAARLSQADAFKKTPTSYLFD